MSWREHQLLLGPPARRVRLTGITRRPRWYVLALRWLRWHGLALVVAALAAGVAAWVALVIEALLEVAK